METLVGASGKTWKLKVGQAMRSSAPVDGLYASEVRVVKDTETKTPYVLKRVSDSGGQLMEALINEAATWRKIGIGAAGWPRNVVELVDVFVDREQRSVGYLMEYCSGGHIQRRGVNQAIIVSTVISVCEGLRAAYDAGVAVHGNVCYSSVFSNASGDVKVCGFGAARRVYLDDAMDEGGSAADVRAIGALVYEMIDGRPPARSGAVHLPPEAATVLAPELLETLNRALSSKARSRPSFDELFDLFCAIRDGRKTSAGSAAEPAPRAAARTASSSVLQAVRSTGPSASREADKTGSGPGPNRGASLRDMVAKKKAKPGEKSRAQPERAQMHNAPSAMSFGAASPFANPAEASNTMESMITRATSERDEPFDPASLKWLVIDFKRDEARAALDVYKVLFKRPISKDATVAFRSLSFVLWLMHEFPVSFLDASLKQDKFLEWVQGSWPAGAAGAGDFEHGEISLFAAYLRMKTRFHHRCHFAWNARFEAADPSFFEGRERKVLQGMEELIDTARELALALLESSGNAKMQGAAVLVAEVARAYEGVCALVDTVEKPRSREKLVEVYSSCHSHAYEVLSAAEGVSDVVAQLPRNVTLGIPEAPPDIVAMLLYNNAQTAKGEALRGPAHAPDMTNLAPPAAPASFGAPSVDENGGITRQQSSIPEQPDLVLSSADEAELERMDKKAKKKAKKAKKEKKKKNKAGASDSDDQNVDESDRFFGDAGDDNAVQDEADSAAAPEGALVVHGTNVTGRLIYVPEETFVPESTEIPRLQQGATNEDILAEALGLGPGAADAARRLALPAPDSDSEDDSDDEGGERQPRVREAGGWGSTKTMQLAVVSAQSNPTIEKAHPVFCQCAMCTTAEAVQHTYLLTEKGEGAEVPGATIDLSKRNTSQFEVDPKSVKVGDKLGEGGFGAVHKGRFKNKTVAVKLLNRKMMRNRQVIKEFKAEIGIMCQLDHPNVIKCLGACTKPPTYMMITEFMPRGTLFDVLHKGQIQLNWVLMKRIVMDIARGMAYIHASSLLHRDLKSSNLLLDGNFNVKISDFGLVHYLDEGESLGGGPVGHAGTFQYMAPEVIAHEAATEKSDVYSFAIVLWEIMARKLPYVGMDPQMVAQNVLSSHLRPPILPFFPQPMSVLMNACWHYNPAKRPSFVEIEAIVKRLPG